MNPLVFELKERPGQTVDLSPLTPDRLHGKRREQIESIRLVCGNRRVKVASLFEISGRDSDALRFKRSCDKLCSIGAGMTRGSIEIGGAVGDYLGQSMSGGHIKVRGDAGAWTASGMTGGRIDVLGDCGDFLGGAFPGQPYGMNEGEVYISGNAGDRVGDKMRRGLLVVNGQAGDFVGSRMLAGTIVVVGKAGRLPGSGMKRGTILLARQPQEMVLGVGDCGEMKLQILRLLFQQLPKRDRRLNFLKKRRPIARRFVADLAVQGKGELLVLSAYLKAHASQWD